MPTISLTLSTAAANELTDAFGENYPDTINGQPNPETKAQFAKRQLVALIKQQVMSFRRTQAAAAASAVDPEIT